ncbi:hypothetical protein PLANTIT3_60991 [Plantibacter sp. T3]|nr:hypothetical protein PLANTIT3_60991 [Plantibacter sp. T3]
MHTNGRVYFIVQSRSNQWAQNLVTEAVPHGSDTGRTRPVYPGGS